MTQWKAATCLLVSVGIVPGVSVAQAPRTEAAARSAAIALVKGRSSTQDSSRVVPDSATMYRDFVSCRDQGGRPYCAFTQDKPILMVLVHLVSPDTATVETRNYSMLKGRCPMGPPFDLPVIASTSGEKWLLLYRDGQWVADNKGSRYAC